MRTLKKLIARFPLIMFILTIFTFLFMILIRVSAMGTKLLNLNSHLGKYIAVHYKSSVIVFVVVLFIFILAVMTSTNGKTAKKAVPKGRRKKAPAPYEYDEEYAFESRPPQAFDNDQPPQPSIQPMNQQPVQPMNQPPIQLSDTAENVSAAPRPKFDPETGEPIIYDD